MSLPLAVPLRRLAAFAAVATLAISGGTASAHAPRHLRHAHLYSLHATAVTHLLPGVGLPAQGKLPVPADDVQAENATAGQDDVAQIDAASAAPPAPDGKKYELKLARQGDGQMLDVVYRIGDTYIPDAIDKLSHFLHDSHNEEVKNYDPRTFDVLHTVLAKLDRSSSVIEILCGYRTKATNDALRASHTTNAAEHSQHIEAKAIDMRVPGVPAAELRDAALSLEAGGVGYYPNAQFIHVDTGPVRKWTFAPHAARHSRRHRA